MAAGSFCNQRLFICAHVSVCFGRRRWREALQILLSLSLFVWLALAGHAYPQGEKISPLRHSEREGGLRCGPRLKEERDGQNKKPQPQQCNRKMRFKRHNMYYTVYGLPRAW